MTRNYCRLLTINIVRGGTGVGKTTFALQYSLFGLNRGEKVVYISFEMSEEQIVRDCRDIGWEEIEHYIEQGDMKIIHLFGEDLTFPSLDVAEIVRKALPPRNLRLVIDPLTYPTFYSEKEKRKSLSTIFKDLRKMGTVVITLEDPADGNHIPEGSAMPLYFRTKSGLIPSFSKEGYSPYKPVSPKKIQIIKKVTRYSV